MKPLARKDNLVIQEIDGEILVYDLSANKAFCLNRSSALIWQKCDGKSDVSEIARAMSDTLDSTITEDYIWFALNQLKTENLLAKDDDFSNVFKGMPRREVVKKIRFGFGGRASGHRVAGRSDRRSRCFVQRGGRNKSAYRMPV